MIINFCFPYRPLASPRPRITMRFGYPNAYFPKNYTVTKTKVGEYFVNDFGTEFSTYDGNIDIKVVFHFKFPTSKSFKGFTGKKAEIAKELFLNKPYDKKPDLDNLLKTYMDSLNGIAWKDDSFICNLSAEKIWDLKDEVDIEINYKDIESKDDILVLEYKRNKNEKEIVEKVLKGINEDIKKTLHENGKKQYENIKRIRKTKSTKSI